MSRNGRVQFATCDIGGTVGGWTLKSQIGAGGTARVFLAQRGEREVAAIKLMHPHLAGLWSVRFEREARLLKALKHPAIPELYEFGSEQSQPYLVLELLNGTSLERQEQSANNQRSLRNILEYADQALAALSFMHERGVVHRDLKPSNLFVTTRGALKVLDFGAAAELQGSVQDSQSITNGLLGTPAYMSPEQARGRWDMVDLRSDIWSFAAVLFTLLSGEHVHPAETRNEQLGFAISRSARSIGSVRPDLEPAIVRIIDRALAYDREGRFQNADDFRAALRDPSSTFGLSISDETDPTVRELPQVPRRTGPRAHPSLGLASMLSIPIVCAWALSSSSARPGVATDSKVRPSANIPATSASAVAPSREVPSEAGPLGANADLSRTTRRSKPSRQSAATRRPPAIAAAGSAVAAEGMVRNDVAKLPAPSGVVRGLRTVVETAWDTRVERASRSDSPSSAVADTTQRIRDLTNPLDKRE